jgi:chromosome partitioning protein
LSERVIYRELFLEGLTLLDLRQVGLERRLSLSHVAARQELRSLLELISSREPAVTGPRQAVA